MVKQQNVTIFTRVKMRHWPFSRLPVLCRAVVGKDARRPDRMSRHVNRLSVTVWYELVRTNSTYGTI